MSLFENFKVPGAVSRSFNLFVDNDIKIMKMFS